MQHSSEYDGRVPSMDFNLHFTRRIAGSTEMLKQDSPSGKASSRGKSFSFRALNLYLICQVHLADDSSSIEGHFYLDGRQEQC